MPYYFLEMSKKQQVNAAVGELQLKLIAITKKTGKASRFGWLKYVSIIASLDYARNIYSKFDDAVGFQALKKVIKMEDDKKEAVASNLCWSKNNSESCIFLVAQHFNSRNLIAHLRTHHKKFPELSNDNRTIASITKESI
jgi:hypothetical protein